MLVSNGCGDHPPEDSFGSRPNLNTFKSGRSATALPLSTEIRPRIDTSGENSKTMFLTSEEVTSTGASAILVAILMRDCSSTRVVCSIASIQYDPGGTFTTANVPSAGL